MHSPRLRRAAGRLLALVPAVRRSLRQVTPYAPYRAQRSQLAGEQRQRGEPAWVVLADSTAQGIGASAPERGWFGRVAEEPPGWVVVNLSQSGARTASVIRGEAALRVADLWTATGPPYRGLFADGLHPNDGGCRRWADALGPAVVPVALPARS